MMLNDHYIKKKLIPVIYKAWLYETILVLLLILSIILFLMFHSLFTYTLSLIILSILSLTFLIPIYIVFMTMIYFPIQLSKFIKTFPMEDMSFHNLEIISLEKKVTIHHLLFIPIKCIIDEKEKLFFLPCEGSQINLAQKNIKV